MYAARCGPGARVSRPDREAWVIPGLSVIWVIVFVLLLAVVLDRLLFKPVLRVMDEREARVKSAIQLATTSAERAKAAGAEFEERTRAAQADVYRQMDEMRRSALQARSDLVGQTREEVEAAIAAARAQVAAQADEARAELDRQADQLADAVVVRVLGRKVVAAFLVAAGLWVCASASVNATAGARAALSMASGESPAASGGPGDLQEHAAEPSGAQATPGHASEASGEPVPGEPAWKVIARLVNFAILVGVLFYYLRGPIINYLARRSTEIRAELVRAAETRAAAAADLLAIERKMQALPADIDTLKARGAAEIAAEESRIRQVAETERQRLLDQARREIDLQVRVAERDLTRRAAELTVGLASDRIKRAITDEDQQRLVDRYLALMQK
jgi:F-type H+-transporting ATPase subunit b